MISTITVDWCDACGECLTRPGETRRMMQTMSNFQREVNASQDHPGISGAGVAQAAAGQRRAGALFGGGVNAFNRYESGAVEPPKALVQLFGLLDKHAGLLHKIHTGRT